MKESTQIAIVVVFSNGLLILSHQLSSKSSLSIQQAIQPLLLSLLVVFILHILHSYLGAYYTSASLIQRKLRRPVKFLLVLMACWLLYRHYFIRTLIVSHLTWRGLAQISNEGRQVIGPSRKVAKTGIPDGIARDLQVSRNFWLKGILIGIQQRFEKFAICFTTGKRLDDRSSTLTATNDTAPASTVNEKILDAIDKSGSISIELENLTSGKASGIIDGGEDGGRRKLPIQLQQKTPARVTFQTVNGNGQENTHRNDYRSTEKSSNFSVGENPRNGFHGGELNNFSTRSVSFQDEKSAVDASSSSSSSRSSYDSGQIVDHSEGFDRQGSVEYSDDRRTNHSYYESATSTNSQNQHSGRIAEDNIVALSNQSGKRGGYEIERIDENSHSKSSANSVGSPEHYLGGLKRSSTTSAEHSSEHSVGVLKRKIDGSNTADDSSRPADDVEYREKKRMGSEFRSILLGARALIANKDSSGHGKVSSVGGRDSDFERGGDREYRANSSFKRDRNDDEDEDNEDGNNRAKSQASNSKLPFQARLDTQVMSGREGNRSDQPTGRPQLKRAKRGKEVSHTDDDEAASFRPIQSVHMGKRKADVMRGVSRLLGGKISILLTELYKCISTVLFEAQSLWVFLLLNITQLAKDKEARHNLFSPSNAVDDFSISNCNSI